jgi:hypothetical protein
MARKQSREKRHARFMEAAERLFSEMEDWYDQHPEASFEEIEQEARQRRRAFMGKSLEIWVNGRDTGYQVEGVKCEQCGEMMAFEGYRAWGIQGLEGETTLERAYYVCPQCKGQTIFPPG